MYINAKTFNKILANLIHPHLKVGTSGLLANMEAWAEMLRFLPQPKG